VHAPAAPSGPYPLASAAPPAGYQPAPGAFGVGAAPSGSRGSVPAPTLTDVAPPRVSPTMPGSGAPKRSRGPWFLIVALVLLVAGGVTAWVLRDRLVPPASGATHAISSEGSARDASS
jgi:hypothetical protein